MVERIDSCVIFLLLAENAPSTRATKHGTWEGQEPMVSLILVAFMMFCDQDSLRLVYILHQFGTTHLRLRTWYKFELISSQASSPLPSGLIDVFVQIFF